MNRRTYLVVDDLAYDEGARAAFEEATPAVRNPWDAQAWA